ncbi:MAG: FAD-binding oxidoreductase [bacterium]
MKQEVIEQLEGYADIVREIEIARKYGRDFNGEKGSVKSFIDRLHPKKIDMRVSEIIDETVSTRTFRLVSTRGSLPPFQAGQYVSVSVEVDRIKTSRAYSIASAPCETAYFDLTVRRMEKGLVSNFLLDRIEVGDSLVCSGPKGTFHHNPIIHDDTLVLLAGGSGITPLMSMIRDTVARGLNRTLYLLYGNRSGDDIIFHEELLQMADRHPNFHYLPVVEHPAADYQGKTGYITADLIREAVGDISGKSFFICGPQAMYNFCLPELKKLNVPGRKIRKEMFGTPINIWEYPGWPAGVKPDKPCRISVNGSHGLESVSAQSILVTLEKNGLVIPSTCRSGKCSMCRVKILSGSVFQPQGTPVRKSDRQFGYVHACVSYPLEDLEILI